MGEEVSLAAMSAAPALHPQLAKQLAGRQHVPLQPDCGAQALGVARKCSLTSTASWGCKATPSVLSRYRNSLCKTGAHFVGRPVKREVTESYTEDKYEARPDNIKVRDCHGLLLQWLVTAGDSWHLGFLHKAWGTAPDEGLL